MKLIPLGLLPVATVLALAASASAQSINVDIDNLFGVPTSGLAAAGQAGMWNYVAAASGTTPLVATSGALTTATMTRTIGTGGATAFNNLATLGNDQALMDDAEDSSTGTTWTIAHLTAGTYNVFTYAWAPDDPTYRSGVSVNGSGIQSVGGTWTGTYAQGLTHAVNSNIVVPADGSITIVLTVVSSYATFNGVQIVDTTAPPPPAFTPYCFGDGTGTACPCANAGAAGNGCASSVNAAGANLAATGTASITNDTLSLNGSGMPNSSALYFQGTTQIGSGAGATFGDGLRCAGGSVTRLGTKTNVNGSSSYPGGSTAISIKGANAAGNTRTYQTWYRNAAAFCNPETYNLTNGGQVTWGP